MKYFIITKKQIKILKRTAIFLLTAGIITVVGLKTERKTVKTFLPQKALESGLPTEENNLSLRAASEYILGFAADKPSDIISEYSKAFDVKKENTQKEDTNEDGENQSENNEIKQPEPTPAPENTEKTPEPEKLKVNETTAKNSGEIKNQTAYEVGLAEFENEPINLKGSPCVLIVHTHTTESYAPEDGGESFINDNSRSCDSDKNMIAVGNVIEEKLKKAGISVIHDTTFHDYPVYKGAYGRSLTTINSQKEKNPQINVILDVHRDAVVSADGTRTKMTANINGEKAAQVMFVVGTNAGGLSHPGWRDNLTFAAKIQKKACDKYAGLMRPLNLREERFNQHLTPCSVIVEVGTNGNTLSEAKRGAAYIGECISEVLKGG